MGVVSDIKDFIRGQLLRYHLDITPNLRNDRQTMIALKRLVLTDSNCLDIGAHKGEITDLLLKYAPRGSHHLFEPIPALYDGLKRKYRDIATLHQLALSDRVGEVTFHIVESKLGYSGLRQRSYPTGHSSREINVKTAQLDEVLLPDHRVDFIKLDIEGGEYHALLGAQRILKQYKPSIIFEFGKGAADHYDVTPSMLYDLLITKLGYQLFTLSGFLKKENSLSEQNLNAAYEANKEYYFVAVAGGSILT